MKEKSLKKVLTTVAILIAMLVLASLTLVGCGNKQNPQPTQLNFDEHFKLTTVETYSETVADPTIEGLNTAKIYKKLTFTAQKTFDMTSFTFTAKAENKVDEKVQIHGDFENINLTGDFSYDFNKGGEQSFKYEYKLPENASIRVKIIEGQTVTITIGVKSNSTPASFTEYTTPLSLFNFVIEG